MSRTYLLYFEGKGMWKDKMYCLLNKWCGHSQIFKLEYYEDEQFYGYIEMGCSSGVHPYDTMSNFVDSLKKNGCSDVSAKYWDLHPNKAEYYEQNNTNV